MISLWRKFWVSTGREFVILKRKKQSRMKRRPEQLIRLAEQMTAFIRRFESDHFDQ